MAGGLLNLIAVGNGNLFLTGNPSKTFFRVTYSKYTNFGLQKFRIDYQGSRDLRVTEPSTFTFKIPRYAELLMDTFVVITIPDIWSPIYDENPYQFRWIEDLGSQLIDEIEINCGSFTLARYNGAYISAMVDRDFTSEKKNLFNEMTGNTVELNNPAKAYGRSQYPSAKYTSTAGIEPSIRGRNLYIPLNAWFSLNSRCAFPLIALQYNELEIRVRLRPIQDMFRVKDVLKTSDWVRPDFSKDAFQMYRFLQSPLADDVTSSSAYGNTFNTWNADVHLVATYAFLSKEEAKLFAKEDQTYLMKDVYTYKFDNVYGSQRVKMESTGMVANWMWYFQRTDAYSRNEWNNYSNWPYSGVLPSSGTELSNNFISGDLTVMNQKEIMSTMGIVLDGAYRENSFPSGIFNYVEKYTRTNAFAKDGLYCYQFCLDTNPNVYQPSGAINLAKFNLIELEFSTIAPPLSTYRDSSIICENNVIAVQKSNWQLFEYTYNLVVFEERYNIVSFVGGNAGLLYSR